jgi:hypothetical protein
MPRFVAFGPRRAHFVTVGPARHQNRTKREPGGHALRFSVSYSRTVMRGAFVLRLGRETEPSQGRFEGWVEEIDSGQELRFHSAEELLGFLGQRFDAVFGSSGNGPEQCQKEPDSASQQPISQEKGRV